MSERTWSMLAYRRDHEGSDQHRRGIPEWRLASAVAWAAFRGFDSILVERTDDPPSSSRSVTHHVCSDPLCPGGCE